MAKTSEHTSTVNRYRVTLGNTDHRSGHRVDCAQVRVRIFVDATSVDEAVELARAGFSEDVYFGARGKGRLGVVISIAPERLRPVDVKQVTTDL